jgi:hypothetical protein
MKKRFLLTLILLITCIMTKAQEPAGDLPYHQIPDAPETYSQGSIVARMVDGLGFRYYWATEGLRTEDLQFKPGADSRTSEQTIDHILGLSNVILNSALHKANEGMDTSGFNFEQKRRMTLENLKTAADIFRKSNDLSEFTVVFQRKDGSSEFPFWNQINGPISDAIWHCGQVVSFRRSSGNPFNSKASVFMGKLMD